MKIVAGWWFSDSMSPPGGLSIFLALSAILLLPIFLCTAIMAALVMGAATLVIKAISFVSRGVWTLVEILSGQDIPEEDN